MKKVLGSMFDAIVFLAFSLGTFPARIAPRIADQVKRGRSQEQIAKMIQVGLDQIFRESKKFFRKRIEK